MKQKNLYLQNIIEAYNPYNNLSELQSYWEQTKKNELKKTH